MDSTRIVDQYYQIDRIDSTSISRWLFSNSELSFAEKLVIASIDHEYSPNFRSHQ